MFGVWRYACARVCVLARGGEWDGRDMVYGLLVHPPRRHIQHFSSSVHPPPSTPLNEREELEKKTDAIPLHPDPAPQLKSAHTVSPNQTFGKTAVCVQGGAPSVRMWQGRADGTGPTPCVKEAPEEEEEHIHLP